MIWTLSADFCATVAHGFVCGDLSGVILVKIDFAAIETEIELLLEGKL